MLWVSNVQAGAHCLSFFLLPADPDVEFSATSPAPGLFAGHHVSCPDDNELNLCIVSQLQLNVFLYHSFHCHVASSQ